MEGQSEQPPPGSGFDKVFVAVHGIGEQSRSQTVQSVATRFARSKSFVQDARIVSPQPLGWFNTPEAAQRLSHDLDSAHALARHGFAEVYWADIPRKINELNDTLQETKAWARTVVARAKSLYQKYEARVGQGHISPSASATLDVTPPDFELASDALDEIIETVWTLENLTFLAERVGLFTFDLKEVLNNYLGDVQLVAEFERHRQHVLARFHEQMENIVAYVRKQSANDTPPQIYLVAHSEGTVVSFLGILTALAGLRFRVVRNDGDGDKGTVEKLEEVPDWVRQVRGFMTIGSPIDKHLLLWERMWQNPKSGYQTLTPLQPELADPARRIRWRNYYDRGDPVGFELNTARLWLERQKFSPFFEFEAAHDLGFSRYWLPGKAHNDYWTDGEVFGHFIDDVVLSPDPLGEIQPRTPVSNEPEAGPSNASQNCKSASVAKTPTPRKVTPPGDRWLVKKLSWALPILLSILVLGVGVWAFCVTASHFLFPELDSLQHYVRFMMLGSTEPPRLESSELRLRIASLTALLFGATALGRIPALETSRNRWWVGPLWFLACVVIYAGFEAAVYLKHYAGRVSPTVQSVETLAPETDYEFAKRLLTTPKLPNGGDVQPSQNSPSPALHNSASLRQFVIGDIIVVAVAALLGGINAWLTRPYRKGERLTKRGRFAPDVADERSLRWFRKRARPLITIVGFSLFVAVVVMFLTGNDPISDTEKNAIKAASIKSRTAAAAADLPNEVKIKTAESPELLRKFADDIHAQANEEYGKKFAQLELILGSAPFWPVVIGFIAFLFLWRLSALIFGLAYVWRRYVRPKSSIPKLKEWYRVVRLG